jgi:hypothetical protein
MTRHSRLGLLLLCALLCSGCASTTLRSGKPPGAVAPNYDDRWHPAFLFGLVAFRENYDLSRICRDGWAEVRVRPDPFTALAGLLTLFVYSPSRLTIVCAGPDGGTPPPLPLYAAPTFSNSTTNAKLSQ